MYLSVLPDSENRQLIWLSHLHYWFYARPVGLGLVQPDDAMFPAVELMANALGGRFLSIRDSNNAFSV
jgi:hypothetical protein